MRISDWSSDVCSSDLGRSSTCRRSICRGRSCPPLASSGRPVDQARGVERRSGADDKFRPLTLVARWKVDANPHQFGQGRAVLPAPSPASAVRSEEHTSELQSLMRISYAVFCLKKKKTKLK